VLKSADLGSGVSLGADMGRRARARAKADAGREERACPYVEALLIAATRAGNGLGPNLGALIAAVTREGWDEVGVIG
jgi:hypothetical protein